MNKFYIIAPVIMLAVFAFFYRSFSVTYAEQEAAEEQRIEQEAIAAEARERENERRTQEDAARRTAERLADEAQKKADRRQKWEAVGKDIATDTARFRAEVAELTSEKAELERQRDALRTDLATIEREAYDLSLAVEAARIEKERSEMQIQRMTEIINRQAAASVLTSEQIIQQAATTGR